MGKDPFYALLQRRAWLKRPMREPQILPQVSHLWVNVSALVGGRRSFLRARFSTAAADILFSLDLSCVVRVALHFGRSAARSSQSLKLMSRAFMFLLQASL